MLQVGYLDLECGILNEQLAHPWIAARGTYTWSGMFNVLHVLMEGMFTTNLMRILTMLVYCHIANLFFFFLLIYIWDSRPSFLQSLSVLATPCYSHSTQGFSQCPAATTVPNSYKMNQAVFAVPSRLLSQCPAVLLQCPQVFSQCPALDITMPSIVITVPSSAVASSRYSCASNGIIVPNRVFTEPSCC